MTARHSLVLGLGVASAAALLGAGGRLPLAAPKSADVRRATQDRNAEQRRALSGLAETTAGDQDDEAAGETDTPGSRRDGAADLIPDTYVVKKGDTLWDICESYFHDPWRWPKVWALNPEISNPHWIFPGQAVKLGGTTRSTPGAATDTVAGGGSVDEGS
ncbi:MAG TPA: LysM peptidoglycan-binding domain-containing protein, partial [Polyangia bacterium]|nr:LysM peptidoglycan-binding domain-containing protein [Polyangia bacterium]